jgi:hypothetical protein
MALRIKCKCGASLKVSSKQADQRLNCPTCQRPFRIPAAKFREAAAKAAGLREKATLPQHPTAAGFDPNPQPVELDLVPANLDAGLAPPPSTPTVVAGLEIEPPPPEKPRHDMFDELDSKEGNLHVEADRFDEDVERRKLELGIHPGKLDSDNGVGSTNLPDELEFLSSGVLEDLVKQSTNADSKTSPRPGAKKPELEPLGAVPLAMTAPSSVPVAMTAPATLGYARDDFRQTSIPTRNAAGDVIQGPQRGFWADAFASFIYPVWSGGNFAGLVILAVLAVTRMFLSEYLGGCFGLICTGIISGWFCSVYFSVIQDSASGSDDLPGIKMEGGWVDDIIKPLFKFIGAFALALAPAVLLAISAAAGQLSPSAAVLIPIWAVAGLFLLPVCLLLFAFNAPGMLMRPDLIFLTIVRTILPYLGMWLMLLLAAFGYAVSISATILAEIGLGPLAFDVSGANWLVQGIISVVQVYLAIAAMRIIGLYYLHFKRRFAIRME